VRKREEERGRERKGEEGRGRERKAIRVQTKV
jgi:hypothetical protein